MERTARFPKHERFRMARRLEESAFAFYDLLLQAGRLDDLVSQCRNGDLSTDRLTAAIQGWVAHAAHGDTWGLRRAVLGEVVI